MPAILQVCYSHSWSDDEAESSALDWAKHVKPTIPGLVWKIFSKNSAENLGCGTYLFDSMTSATNFAEGDILKAVATSPGINSVDIRVFDVMEEPSLLAGAPVSLD